MTGALRKPLPADRVAYYLAIWVSWMHHGADDLGYPPHSIPFASTGGPRTVDDFCESLDVSAAEAMDAIISDLDIHHQIAVHHFNLGAVWRFTRLHPERVYAEAILAIEAALPKKGLT